MITIRIKKVWLCLLLAVCLTVGTVLSPVAGNNAAYAALRRSVSAVTLSIPLGMATFTASTNAKSGVSIKGTFTLQRYAGGSWGKVYTWTRTATTSMDAAGAYIVDARGKYRVKAKYTYSKSGSTTETYTCYSPTRTY